MAPANLIKILPFLFVFRIRSAETLSEKCSDKKLNLKPCFEIYPKESWPHLSEIEVPESLHLQCLFRSEETMTTQWKINGTKLSTTAHVELTNKNSSLLISWTTAGDTGIYTCLGCNVHGCVNYTQYIPIQDHRFAPIVNDVFPPGGVAYAKLGDDVNISCTFYSGDLWFEQSMAWYRDGERVVDTKRIVSRSTVMAAHKEKTLSLSIENVTSEDFATYVCFGQVEKLNASREITLERFNSTETDAEDTTRRDLFISLGSVCGGAAIIFVVIVYFIRRNHGNNYKYLKWLEPNMKHFDIPNHDVTFDVFLSYSNSDYDWVKPVLFEQLRTSGYKVYVDFKDFMPGHAIVDNILEGIYKSQRTLVVMSRSFLSSVWTTFEMDQALIKAMMQRRDVLVLVKIDDCVVPAKLLGITFLDWTDPKVRPHFWTRLQKAMGNPGSFTTEQTDPPENKNTDTEKGNEINDNCGDTPNNMVV